jgi:preprotein translocase subunit SecG
MQQIILIIHVLACISLVALVLLQHGKGADVGAAFGSGASNTMFGSVGSTPFLVKVTGLLAGIFFLTSLGLTYLVSTHAQVAKPLTPIHKTISPTPIPATNKESEKKQPATSIPGIPAEPLPETPN